MLTVYKLTLFLFSIKVLLCDIKSVNSTTTTERGQLVFAHILFRHGDRSIVTSYPNDPWKDPIYWKDGFGQLTNIGKLQHFELGKYFRRRYKSLLKDGAYHWDKVYIQSTDVDRTLMSAASNLAGFFPAEGNQTWNVNLKWQPIPVHTVPEKLDEVLAAKKPCPRYKNEMKKYKKSSEFKALLKKYEYLFDYLTKHTGRKVSSFEDVSRIHDTLFIEHLRNYTLPKWTKKVFVPGANNDMDWVSHFAFKIPTITTQLARLKSGFLIREIYDRFIAKSQSKLLPNRSLWIYSAHDSTIENILNSLGLFRSRNPPYAASMLFELYKIENKYYIQLFYKNTTAESLSPLNIPNCGEKCPLEKFYSIYKDIIPEEDHEMECQLSFVSRIIVGFEEGDLNSHDRMIIICICFAIVVLILAIAIWKFSFPDDLTRNTREYTRI